MTSNINYASINENFPVPGQDNDTQVFRDNFDAIKNSLATAKNEVTELLETSAKLNNTNDFGNNQLENAVFRNTKGLKYAAPGVILAPEGESSIDIEINYENGIYQIYRFANDSSINLTGLPIDNYGKMTVELYGDGITRTLSFVSVNGTTFRKSNNFPSILTATSSIDPVIIEVWRHDSNKIFLNYLGEFS
jgi:hypothetical protein